MTNEEIKNKIAILEKSIASNATPDNFKEKMREQVKKLTAELTDETPPPAPKPAPKPSAKPTPKPVVKKKATKKPAVKTPSTTATLPKIRKEEPVKVETGKKEQVVAGHTLTKVNEKSYLLKVKGTDQTADFTQQTSGKWFVSYISEKRSFDSLEEAVKYVVAHVFKGAVKEFTEKATKQARRRKEIIATRKKAGKPAEPTVAETSAKAEEVIQNKIIEKAEKGEDIKVPTAMAVIKSFADSGEMAIKGTNLPAGKISAIKAILNRAVKQIEDIIKK